MDVKTETPDERERLLASLHPREREIVESVLAHHPALTAAEAVKVCKAFGM